MPKRTKCLYCELNDASHCETISISITSRKYWTNVLFRIQKRIITLPNIKGLHACSEEHLQQFKNIRQVAKWTQQAKIKNRLNKIVLATRALNLERKVYDEIVRIQGSESGGAKLQKIKVNQKKILLVQRMRRLRELMPEVPEDTALLDTFLRREIGLVQQASTEDLTSVSDTL